MQENKRSNLRLLAAGFLALFALCAAFEMRAKAPWVASAVVDASQNSSNPVPFLSQPLAPAAAVPGGAGFTLIVNGTGFVPGSVVNWDGQPQATTFVSTSQVTAQITAADIASAGTASVTVSSPAPGGGISNGVFFAITAAVSPVTMGRTDLSATVNPEAIAVGDFKGNGRSDLAIADAAGNVTILLANGDGTFQSSTVSAGSAATAIIAADFNGDGKLDLAVANGSAGTISVLLGNGDGTFQPPVTYGVGANPSALVAGDFNADGKLDLVVGNSGSGTVSILLGNGDGTFQTHVDYATGANPCSLAVGDFNRDGKLDLVTANSDNTVAVLLGAGDGSFLSYQEYAAGSGPSAVIAADFNGDDSLDLAVANPGSNNISILLGNGDGTFQPQVSYTTAGTGATALIGGDFDGDGNLDLAVANANSNNASLLLGNGDGTFQTATTFATGSGPLAIAAADFNNDGRLDLAVPSQSSGTVSILLQAPVVSLSTTTISFGTQNEGSAAAAPVVTLSNTGSAPLSVAAVGIGGANAGDFSQSNTCSAAAISAHARCAINVNFQPTTTTSESATLTITDSVGEQTISLSGTGVPAFSSTSDSSSGVADPVGQPATGNQASFVGLDTTTQGNWRGVYGGDGYSVAGDLQSIPPYVASFSQQNTLNYVWDPYPSEARDLERASTNGRIAATWYSTQTFSFNVNFDDGNYHQFALYALDWDSEGRSETIRVMNSITGATLDVRSISNFSNGIYLVWNLAGNINISVSVTGGSNGVISGAFFGAGGPDVSTNVIVSPPVVSVPAGATQQFSAVELNSANLPITWSLNPNVGTISATGLYTAPAAVTSAQRISVIASTSAGTGTATVNVSGGATATFLNSDISTQGSWRGVYGADGYAVAGDSQSIPGYASFAVQNQVNYTWTAGTSDPRALQTANGSGRIAAAWYNPQTFNFAIHFNDRNVHQVALYALDWDGLGRSETIQITDANTNAVLDSRTISNFANGVYLIWNLSGSVVINVTTTNGDNAAISGVFFGGATANTGTNAAGSGSAPSGTVSFVTIDSTTQGNWQGTYGTEAYFVAGDSESVPSSIEFGMQNQFSYIWDASGNETRDLEKASGPGRIAATLYNPQNFTMNVNFTDGATHSFALYALDWDSQGRAETVQILDANTNAVLDSRSIANFSNGVYLVWNLSGNVIISVSATSGPNAVVSGIFMGTGAGAAGDPSEPAAAAVSFVASDAATQGNWQGVYGTDGYSIANAGQQIPPYAAFFVQNQLNYTWNPDPTDPRALESSASSSGRIASAWYSVHDAIPPTFDFDVNFVDGNSHQFAIYAIDWDNQGRAETIQIIDANSGSILDTRQISNFTNGIYLIWNIAGHVKVNVTETVGPNCVISGVFFGGVPGVINVNVSPQSTNVQMGQTHQFTATVTGTTNQNVTWSISPNIGTISSTGLYTAPTLLTSSQPITMTATSAQNGTRYGTATINLSAASAAFVANDTTTQGNWQGVYGADGYSIAGDSQSIPSYASLAVLNPNGMWVWNGSTSDPRALETAENTGRIAAAWYKNHDSFYFDVNMTDGQPHQFAIYALDWDSTLRSETVQVLDANTNALLDSRVISNFNGGVYLVWNITGHVTININVASGANAVVSAAFFH